MTSDQVVEWLYDYGKSVPRVLDALVLVYLAFTLFYGVTGSVVRIVGDAAHPLRVTTRNPLDLRVGRHSRGSRVLATPA